MRLHPILAACILMAFTMPLAAQRPDVDPIAIRSVSAKLGVRLMPDAPHELELGHTATTMLADVKKIAEYGIKDMHEGARVTITCVGPNRLRIEADEIDPAPKRAAVTLTVNPTTGDLTPAPERAAPPKPQDKP